MAISNISKISSVILISQGTQNPVAYFNATGSYQFDDANAQVTINVGLTSFTNRWGNVTVNGQTPSTVSELKTLLNSVFGA